MTLATGSIITIPDAREKTGCYCPDDCSCRSAYRFTYCGCKAHDNA